MIGLITSAAVSYVVGSTATFVGNGVYEIARTYMDYYWLDRENGYLKDHPEKRQDNEILSEEQ